MLILATPILLLLLPLPLPAMWLLPPYRDARPSVQVPFLPLIAEISGQHPGPGAVIVRPSWIQRGMAIVVWLLVVLALARPQWLEDPVTKNVPMRDMLIAVDLSGSMETKDFTDNQGNLIDRLTAVKQVLDNFLARRKDDRIGLIVFGSAAFAQAPFTDDLDVLRTLLKDVEVRMAGPKTALGDAMGLAITMFEQSEVEERVMIVLTDGNDTGSLVPPDRAAQIARDNKIVVHCVGMGDPRTAGEEKLDEAVLRDIAGTTGGKYFFAADRSELQKAYNELEKLTPHKVETLSYRPQRDLFHWPLAAAFCLTLFYHIICFTAVILHRDQSTVGIAEETP